MKRRAVGTTIWAVTLVLLSNLAAVVPAFAAEDGGITSPFAAIGAGLAIGAAVLGGGIGQGRAVSAMLEAFGRNPSVGGKMLPPMLIGLAFIESLVIIAFVVAYMSLS